ncbi:Putative Mn2+ efflux pump MntP [Pseudobutyrivibrio sp. YE44]|uniref:manganese efflux pump n=1 Tax=Pseudobutyrivibrio sp. YE44 TaxID=1520802 RepID=UPI00088A8DBB|nr:manganese efflux pump [Pseudobutyrivibrio sp. YE44]SDB19101.1 Putative Mn2+ efflux pump MntP [Pseudobutyrivibrio sp. YE44]
MNWLENVLIIAGILLDVFAAMEIQGAMVSHIKKKTLLIACAVVAAMELAFYFAGYFLCTVLVRRGDISDPIAYGEEIAAIVLALLGIRLIAKAIKREFIQEHLKETLKVFEYTRMIAMSSLYTAVAGGVCALVGITIWQLVITIIVISILMVILGLYTGLHFGFENKTIAYVAGAILLWGVSIEMFLC